MYSIVRSDEFRTEVLLLLLLSSCYLSVDIDKAVHIQFRFEIGIDLNGANFALFWPLKQKKKKEKKLRIWKVENREYIQLSVERIESTRGYIAEYQEMKNIQTTNKQTFIRLKKIKKKRFTKITILFFFFSFSFSLRERRHVWDGSKKSLFNLPFEWKKKREKKTERKTVAKPFKQRCDNSNKPTRERGSDVFFSSIFLRI